MAQTNLVLPTFIIPNTTPGIDWENASNILLADSLYATATGSTQVLTVGYVGNLNLSQGDVVTNIVVAVKGYRGSFNTTLQIFYIDDTTGIEYSYPLLPSFQGFDGTNTLWTLPASLFATTFTVDQINNFKLRMIADGELHLDTIEVNVIYTPVGTLPAPVTPTSGETVCCEYVQAQKFQLAQSMTSSDTTCLVQSFDYSDGTPIQITDFSGGAVQADPNDYEALIVIDQGVEGKEENVRITAIDHNFNGTGFTRLSFGSVANRGLAFKWPYTTDVTLRNDHTGTAEVVISNSAPFYDRFLKKCQIGALVSAPISVLKDDVSIVSPATKLNFHGSVTVVQDGTDTEEADIYITAGGGTTPPQVVGVGSGTSGNVQVNNLTYTVPVSGLNRGGLIQISTEELVTVTAVDVGGVAAVQVVSQTDVPNNLRSEQWICVAPPLGTQTVTITLSGVAYISSGSEILTGVDPVTPTGTFAGAGGTDLNPTVGLSTTYDNSLIFDGLVTALTPIVYTEGSGQTLQWSHTANTDTRQGGSSVEPSGLQPDAITMDYAITQNTDWVITAVEVKGITTASATGQTGILWEDEGVPLGTAGTVDEVDFTGAGVTASRVGNKVTVNVPGGGSALSLETDGVANGDQTLLNLIAGTGITLTDDGLGGVTIDSTGGGSSVGNLARQFDDFVYSDLVDDGSLGYTLSGNFSAKAGVYSAETDHPGIVTLDNTTDRLAGFAEMDSTGAILQGLLNFENDFDITIYTRFTHSGGTAWSVDYRLEDNVAPVIIQIDGTNGIRYDIGGGLTASGATVPASGDWFKLRFLYDASSTTITLSIQIDGNAIESIVTNNATTLTGKFGVLMQPITSTNLDSMDIDWVDTIYRTISTGVSGISASFTAAEAITIGDPVGTSAVDTDNVALANWFLKEFGVDGSTPSGLQKAAYIGNDTFAVVYATGIGGLGTIGIVEVDRATMTMSMVDSDGGCGGQVGNIDSINICSLGTVGKFLIAFAEDGVNDGAVVVGTWDGVSLAFGTAVTINGSGDVGAVSCCSFGTDRAAVYFQEDVPDNNDIHVITVSGLVPTDAASFSFGDSSWANSDAVMTQTDTEKFVIVNNSSRGRIFEFVSPSTLNAGTIITTLVSANVDGNTWVKSALDGNFLILTGDSGYALEYCSVSGTTITSQDVLGRSSVPRGALICIDATTFYMYESNDTVGTSGIYQVNISGGNTIDAPILIASRVLPTGFDLVYLETEGYFVILKDTPLDLPPSCKYFIQGMSGNFIGIAQSSVARGASVSVLLAGVDTNQTGLSSGTIYEVTDGALVATLDVTVPYKVTGQSPTEVIV